jgi:GAF domain-containing protein
MKRRSKSSASIKGRHRKAARPERSKAPKTAPRSKSPPSSEDTVVARLARELRETTEQHTATSEILRVISSSPSDLQPVFQAMLKNAVRLCGAKFGNIYRWDGDALHLVATQNVPAVFAQARGRSSLRPSPQTPTGRMLANKTVVHVADMRAEKAYADRDPYIVAGVELGSVRTVLMVPMLKNNELIGAFSVYRQEVRPFTDKQIELVQNFASQAVIAIENARLLNELRQRTSDLTERTADLTEALDQQTATSEVLQVISNSPGDLEPAFQAMLENATRICEAKFGVVFSFDGNEFHFEAQVGTPPELAEHNRARPMPQPLPGSHLDRLRQTKGVSYTADYAAEGIPAPPVTLGGARSTVDVPMLKDNELVGAFSIYRQEVRPFTEKQIELVKNFAAQAVIAIENARLLNELRQSLEQQTATADVLKVISRSTFDLQTVLNTLVESAARLCAADTGGVQMREGDEYLIRAHYGVSREAVQYALLHPLRPDRSSTSGRAALEGNTIHIPDVLADPEYHATDYQQAFGVRTTLGVPLLRDGTTIGVFLLARAEVNPFTEKQIELVTTFADQAVIAIENARLLNELRQRTADLTEALEQQTATSEVLKVISSSPGELAPVFATLLAEATELCQAKFGSLFLLDGDVFDVGATYIPPSAGTEPGTRIVIGENPGIPLARILQTKQLLHITDLRTDQSYIERNARIVSLVERAGARTLLAVPMLKGAELIGAITIYRDEVRDFTDKQMGLVTNFAAQAVIALENARLLNELRERTDQLAEQSQELAQLNQQLEQRVTDQVDEIERMSRLRRFLPPQVADLIVASGSEKQLESHRREITALFCDLRGFTGFTESADAEDVMALLRDYHAAIGELVIKYSGTLERYAGDGVMVIFNDPVLVENPALQAVLMALELRNALGALTQTWSRLGHEIGFGIGIAHGFATLGTIGYEGRFDYAAIGTVSNVASRLCDEAKPGQILISARVLTKVENAVKVEPAGEFELKGIRRPLAAYNVIAAAL